MDIHLTRRCPRLVSTQRVLLSRVLLFQRVSHSLLCQALSLTPPRSLYRFWLHAICIRVHCTTDAPRIQVTACCVRVVCRAGSMRGATPVSDRVNFRQICGARIHVRYMITRVSSLLISSIEFLLADSISMTRYLDGKCMYYSQIRLEFSPNL